MPPKASPAKPGTVDIIVEKDGSKTIKIEGDWYNPDAEQKLKSPPFKYDQWLEEHLKNDRPELKIPTLPGLIAKEYAPKAEKMYNALLKVGCPPETAKDLCCLVLYDLVVLLDDSSTMQFTDEGKRRETLIQVMERVCTVYSLARDRGVVSVKFFNEPQGRANYTTDKVQNQLMTHTKWKGVTRIGTELKRKVLDTFVFNGKVLKELKKPLLIIIITDGEVWSTRYRLGVYRILINWKVEGEVKGLLENVISQAITALSKEPKIGKHGVTIQFAHVGNDQGARQLLTRLKNTTDKTIEGNIDCLLGEKLEHIVTPEKTWDLTANLLIGSIMARWNKMQKPIDIVGTVDANGYNEDDLMDDIE